MKVVYDDNIVIEYAKDGWVSRVVIPLRGMKILVDEKYDTVTITYEGEHADV